MKKTFLLLAATCCLVINLNAAKLTNVKFIDNNGKEQTCSEATIVENASKPVYWNAGWYVVNSDVTLSEGAICTGGGGALVYLILMDGKTLTVNGKDQGKGYPGIDVSATFAIFGQANQTGALVAHGTGSAAGIGVGGEITYDIGSVFIYGGNITSYGGPDGGNGIGKGATGEKGNITIYNIARANVFAAGGDDNAGMYAFQYTTIATDLVIKADNTNPPTTVIKNDGSDLTSSLAGKKYVSIERPKPTTYTITATATNGTVTGGGEYEEGKTVTLTATPNQGYEFKEWSDGATANPYTFTATKDVTLEAVFKEVGDGLDEVTGDRLQVTGSRKVLRNGQLLIIREGVVFNAMGVKL